MQILEKLRTERYLLISLASTAFAILFANYFGNEIASLTSNGLNLLVTGTLLVLSIIMITKNGVRGSHGKAWIFFAASILFWFIGERIWTVYELVYQIDPWPSEADFFWLAGYPLYFAFSILYLKPFKNAISKKILIPAILISAALLIPTLYMTIANNIELSKFELGLAASYPISDAISLVPAIIGIGLFFKGELNFSWSLLLTGMFCFVVADTAFLFLTLDDSYYTGHPMDIPYIWAYVLLLFGLNNHLQIFKKRNKENAYHDQENLR